MPICMARTAEPWHVGIPKYILLLTPYILSTSTVLLFWTSSLERNSLYLRKQPFRIMQNIP